MKTAIIFAGFFRTFDYVKQTFADLVMNPLNCDIFFAAPHTMFALPENEIVELHGIYSQNANLVDPAWFGDRLKSFKLLEHNSQIYKDLIIKHNISQVNAIGQHTWRILSYMHNISESVSVFKNYVMNNNVHYDLVILTRPDIKYYRPINVAALDMNKINFALHSMVGGSLGTCSSAPSKSFNKPFNDQMVAGTQENILVYHNIYDSVLSYHKNEGVVFNSETFWGVHCIRNGLDCVGKDFVLYELWRESKY
jgi:hypothetical protein